MSNYIQKTKTWSEKLKKALRTKIIAGIAILVPFVLTVYLIRGIVSTLDSIFAVLPEFLRPPESLTFPGSGVILALLIALAAGTLFKNIIGHQLLLLFNQMVEKIPVVATIYKLFREVSDALLDPSKAGFKKVVMVEWPRKGAWTLAFVASDAKGEVAERLMELSSEPYYNLFVPTTPNPTSGFYCIVAVKEVIPLQLTVDQAFKIVVSGGTIVP